MRRTLLLVAAAAMFLSTLVIPTIAHADGGAGTTSCNGGMCKP